MDDSLALLIGRVILAFGRLDQIVWIAVDTLETKRATQALRRGEAKGFERTEIDRRFEHRLKHLRRLCVAHSGNDPTFMTRVDRTLQEVRVLERIRAHLAHGSVHGFLDGVEVDDEREMREHSQAWMTAVERGASAAELEGLWNKHLSIFYSSADLRSTAEALVRFGDEIIDLSAELSDQLGSPPAQAD
jgi:hypothetical protein